MRAPRQIPVEGIFVFRVGFFVKTNRLSGHLSVWPKCAGGPLPKGWFWPCPSRARQCDVRSRRSRRLRRRQGPRASLRDSRAASPRVARVLACSAPEPFSAVRLLLASWLQYTACIGHREQLLG